jgi:hypothetical protein
LYNGLFLKIEGYIVFLRSFFKSSIFFLWVSYLQLYLCSPKTGKSRSKTKEVEVVEDGSGRYKRSGGEIFHEVL